MFEAITSHLSDYMVTVLAFVLTHPVELILCGVISGYCAHRAVKALEDNEETTETK